MSAAHRGRMPAAWEVELSDDYEWIPLRLPPEVTRISASTRLSIEAEYRGWELTRVRLYTDVQWLNPRSLDQVGGVRNFYLQSGEHLRERLLWLLQRDRELPQQHIQARHVAVPPGVEHALEVGQRLATRQRLARHAHQLHHCKQKKNAAFHLTKAADEPKHSQKNTETLG